MGLVQLYERRLQQLSKVMGRVRLHAFVGGELHHFCQLIALCLDAIGDVVSSIDNEGGICEELLSSFQ